MGTRLTLTLTMLATVAGTGCFEAPGFIFKEPGSAGSGRFGPRASVARISSDPSIAGFQKYVYPITRTYCFGCHVPVRLDGKAGQSPFHAAEDSELGHSELLLSGKVNLESPADSRIVERLKVDLHECWTDCDAAAAEMLAAIQSWAAERNSAGNAPASLVTAELALPANIATAKKLTYPIDRLFSQPVAGAKFEIQVVRFANGYRFFNPSISTTNAVNLYVKGIDVVMNGVKVLESTTYDLVDRAFASSSTFTVLSTASMTLPEDKGPAEDKIAIAFGDLRLGDGPVLAPDRFASARQVIATNCGSCHTSNVQPLFASFTTEAQFLATTTPTGQPLVVKNNPAASRIFAITLDGATQRPMPPNGSAATRATIGQNLSAWIQQMP